MFVIGTLQKGVNALKRLISLFAPTHKKRAGAKAKEGMSYIPILQNGMNSSSFRTYTSGDSTKLLFAFGKQGSRCLLYAVVVVCNIASIANI